MTTRSPPQRQDSTVSTTSSGSRTIRASSTTPGRRRSSASTHRPSSGFLARLTGKSSQNYSSPEHSDDEEDEGSEDGESRQGGDGEMNGAGKDQKNDAEDEEGNGEGVAGPSDYWRRTPSPPPAWRQAAADPWDGDITEGNYDIWINANAVNGIDDGPAPLTPPFQMDEPGEDEGEERVRGVETPELDEREYEKRMRDIMRPPDSPSGSNSSARERRIRNGGRNGDKEGGGYSKAYREVMEKDPELVSLQEDEGTLEFPQRDDASDVTPSSMSTPALGHKPLPSPLERRVTPYLHPSVSRLRSHMRTTSSSTQNSTTGPIGRPQHARVPSHFSQISLTRSESTSNLSIIAPAPSALPNDSAPAFTFHPLRHLSAHLFGRRSSGRASPIRPPPPRRTSILGAKDTLAEEEVVLGRPCVLDVRGMIAVGTDSGYTVVYGFGQEIKHILGTEAIVKTSGAVTAVTISRDQTYIAVGHASGNIYLYDLASPHKPSRTALALTFKQVMSGRKEGHLQNSRITHIGFVGIRHTSIVSGDEHGRAFWWSLGRVMGVDSTDVVRILGSYPDAETLAKAGTTPTYPSKRPTTLFAAATLPLGEKSHPTDGFHFSALMTPIKLVVVGMKPTAKTWYRKMRDDLGGNTGGTVGCAAWLSNGEVEEGSDPVLAYSWGTHLRFLRIKVVLEEEEGKAQEVPQFVEGKRYDAPNSIASLQWFDSNHIAVVTTAEILLLDVRTGGVVETTPLQTRLLMYNDFYSGLTKDPTRPVDQAIAASVRVHREKLFLLTRSNVQVGTLLHWNDRILARVHAGDFLGAIQVALAYYESKAVGNYINLPDDIDQRKTIVGTRIRELMHASLDWAFSEDRMHDDTHYTADGRGVDLTSLFEGLATCCIEACLAMGDVPFLFDDTYESYANVGIEGIFLTILEPYIFDQRIRDVPPNIIQALIRLHETKDELDLAEAIIWHVEPIALDINQVVTLCEKNGLWDALIHVYTRAMKDFVAPLVKLIQVVQQVHKQRHSREGVTREEMVPEAYKIFAYVEAILSGISYPSNEALPEYEQDLARADVYAFLFSDRLVFWPEGNEGRLVLSDRSDQAYPYLDLLLQFDTEAFLHSMDIAFEDSCLNDPRASFSRQTIINIMLDLMRSDRYHTGDITLLHIFVCRNLPKYPQFLFIPPTTLQHILVSLTEDEDQSTREDRQLAAEYLLSAYTPRDSDSMLLSFRRAGFWRIVRSAHTKEKRWEELVGAYVDDPEMDREVFEHLEQLVRTTRIKSRPDAAVERGISEALPGLLSLSIRQTAILLDDHVSTLHSRALELLDANEHRKMAYLACLLQPSTDEDDRSFNPREVSKGLSEDARHAYIDLLTRYESSSVIAFLDQVGPPFFDLPKLSAQFANARFFPGQIWALDAQGQTDKAFDVAGKVFQDQGADLVSALMESNEGSIHMSLGYLDETVKMAIRLCREHSAKKTVGVEDMWFGVLHELLQVNHDLSSVFAPSSGRDAGSMRGEVGERVRGLVAETLSALVASSSAHLSFSRLFKRLVDSSDTDDATNNEEVREGKKMKGVKARKNARGRDYAQFRGILMGMLESYRAESDMLTMTTRLVQDDLFDHVKSLKEKREAGWRPVEWGQCAECGKGFGGDGGVDGSGEEGEARGMVVLLGSGRAVHQACRVEE